MGPGAASWVLKLILFFSWLAFWLPCARPDVSSGLWLWQADLLRRHRHVPFLLASGVLTFGKH